MSTEDTAFSQLLLDSITTTRDSVIRNIRALGELVRRGEVSDPDLFETAIAGRYAGIKM